MKRLRQDDLRRMIELLDMVEQRSARGLDFVVAPGSHPVAGPRSMLARARGNGSNGGRHTEGPVQDEWGFFDPTRCGFEAVRALLAAQRHDEGETQQ